MEQIIFVYNADSGWLNFMADAVHKIFSPSTYPCNLCAITYTPTGLPRWRRFVKRLPWPVTFLHRDELETQYGHIESALPAAYVWDGQILQPWIAADEMNACATLDDLIDLVKERTAVLGQGAHL